jgi:hypothetical protein
VEGARSIISNKNLFDDNVTSRAASLLGRKKDFNYYL